MDVKPSLISSLHSKSLYGMSHLLQRMYTEPSSKLSNSTLEINAQQQLINQKQNSLLLTPTPLESFDKQQAIASVSIRRPKQPSLFHFNPLKRTKNTITMSPIYVPQTYRRRQIRYRRFFERKYKNAQFNSTSYCICYCTIIIMGVIIGGWIGGFFELIFSDYNGCFDEHRGYTSCQLKYAHLNVTIDCINVFYTSPTLHQSPFICLCRFQNNSKDKFRDCDFLHATIQYT